jgi:hypothetical protein
MWSAERGQSTLEWVGTLCVVSFLMVGLIAAGLRVPGVGLAQAVSSRLLCAAALADGCGDQPRLIAAYGTEVGKLVREHMPMLAFEEGSRALPVDFRRCRDGACGDGSVRGLVHRSDRGLPVTAFTHVIDRREHGGSLYIQYWFYYADSATLRGAPIVGGAGYHADDWESVQIRIGPDGAVDQRASSHGGYNYGRGVANWGSDAGLDLLRGAAEAIGVREGGGWGPATGLLLVSGGSHAGNAAGLPHVDRFTPGRRVHLVPFEPLAAAADPAFAVSPPWRKRVWRDPEATGTG